MGSLPTAYPEAQAPFMWWLGDTYAANVGAERSRRVMGSGRLSILHGEVVYAANP